MFKPHLITMNDRNDGSKVCLNIAVIGAGLVGSLCACFLAKQGHNVSVYEYREDVRKTEKHKGRSVNLAVSARGRAALRKIGLENVVIQEHGIPLRGRMIHNLKGGKFSITYDVVNNQCIYSTSRKYLNELLVSAAEKHSKVKIFFKNKLMSLNPKDGTMTFLRLDSNESFRTIADLIIGADGAYSTVRKELLKCPLFNYSQEYIQHGYKELIIPPGNNGQFLMEPNYLHIWPRSTFMMIGLPNQDGSWTITLFMPFKKFGEISTPEVLLKFFKDYFPDFLKLVPESTLVNDYFSTTPSHLISVKCKPYHMENKVLLIGDAAHAMVPFFGQGMNAGFEDCLLLDNLMNKFQNNLNLVLPEFSKIRGPDAEAICDLAMYNYIEMRDLVNKKTFLLRKKLDDLLYRLFSNYWLPLYNSVTFTETNYSQCIENKKFQDKIIWTAFIVLSIATILMVFHFHFGFTNQSE